MTQEETEKSRTTILIQRIWLIILNLPQKTIADPSPMASPVYSSHYFLRNNINLTYYRRKKSREPTLLMRPT